MDLYYLDSVQDRGTALMVAAQEGHVRAVEILIAAKAKIDIQKKVRFTIILSVSNYLDLYTERSHSIAHCQSEWSLWSC